MMRLPDEFKEKMRVLLKEEYPAFLKSYEKERTRGLRVNGLKISPEEFEKISPFPLTPIQGMHGAYTYPADLFPGRHPYYAAGLYYLQEPSAMLPAQILDVRPGERVLDLCAAPGGKATALASRLGGKGVLAANDTSASRAKALVKNLEVFGAPNIFVTCARPETLASYFGGFFDHVLVDAPCSGEGMFRKDEAVVRAWTKDKNERCAKMQKGIVLHAADMLRPGGTLVYSTCTFDPLEDECIIAFLLRERKDLRLDVIEPREGFSPGFSASFLQAEGYPAGDFPLERCVRLWPHKSGGEGHFMALLRKLPEGDGEGKDKGGRETKGKGKGTGKRGGRKAAGPLSGEAAAAFFRSMGIEVSGCTDSLAGSAPPALRLGAAQSRAGMYFSPAAIPGDRAGIAVLRDGLYLGEEKKGRFEPAQALAMAMKADGCGHVIDFKAGDTRLVRYLRGESLGSADLDDHQELLSGWYLVCVEGYPLGWARFSGGILKNKLHPGWRGEYAGSD